MLRALAIARKLAPNARLPYLQAFEAGDALLDAHGVNTPLRLAHFLAQVFHETGGLTILWESGNYSASRLVQIFGVGHHSASVTEQEAERLAHRPEAIFERVYGAGNPRKAKELGNSQPGDGFRYRGGGVLQTTGRGNYRLMGARCRLDFEAHPEWVVSAEHALKPALAEWSAGNLNAAADRDDVRAITKRINGGFNGLAEREAWLAKIKKIIGPAESERNAPLESSPPEEPAAPALEPDDTKPHAAPPDAPKTGITEGAKVGAGLGVAGVLAQAWETLTTAPDTILQAVVAMAQKPSFLIAIGFVGVAAYIWWRRHNMKVVA